MIWDKCVVRVVRVDQSEKCIVSKTETYKHIKPRKTHKITHKVEESTESAVSSSESKHIKRKISDRKWIVLGVRH